MDSTIKTLHSYWAYLVIIILIAAVINALIGLFGKKEYGAKDFRVSLFTHPLINIIAVALITIGYSKHKKKLTSKYKLKIIAIFYTIALVLFLSRIPWAVWPN